MIIQHQKNYTSYQLSCGDFEECILRQYANHKDTSIRLWMEHGVYHVRAHDHELHGRIVLASYSTLTAARKRFAELKRNINDSMKKQLFNMS